MLDIQNIAAKSFIKGMFTTTSIVVILGITWKFLYLDKSYYSIKKTLNKVSDVKKKVNNDINKAAIEPTLIETTALFINNKVKQQGILDEKTNLFKKLFDKLN